MDIKLASFDLETDPFERHLTPRAFLAGYTESVKNDKVKTFWGDDCCFSLIDYIDFRARQLTKRKLLIYAHNGGKFDFFFIVKALRDRYTAANLTVDIIGSRICRIVVHEIRNGIRVSIYEFRDSYAILPKRLKDLGLKGDIDIMKLKKDVRDENREEIIKYAKQDCTVLLRAVKEFLDLYPRKLTLASTAFTVLTKRFGLERIKTTEEFDRENRKYYFAGRVQFFDLGARGEIDGKTRYKMADINSAFPSAMLDDHFYCSSPMVVEKMPDDEYMAKRSFYHIEATSLGALPVRDKGIHFPKIRGEFFCSGWELMKGMDLKLIKLHKIYSCTIPSHTENFSDYIQYYYEEKRTAKTESERNFAKLFLNTVYGKFSQDAYKFRDVRLTECWEKPKPFKIKMENNTMLETDYSKHYDDLTSGISYWSRPTNIEGQEKKVEFINVLTAASITGKVRATMMEALHRVGNEVYCDTDSILAEDISGLEFSDKLGEWGVDGSFDKIFIGGKKLYALHRSDEDPKKKEGDEETHWKTACKGVRLSPSEICEVALGVEKTYKFDAPNFSPYSSPKFISRRINRADKRKSAKVLYNDDDLEDILTL